ncbi:MAG TPA: N-acetyltransferase [Pyrinomonadaceae bacterium]|nr:N-acetyltransferase [Pyrinomonadaceae bacterium]
MLTSGGALFETAGGRAVSLRPATEEDYEALVRVYASTRADELTQVTWWDDAQKLAFCRSQYDAQKAEYEARFPDAEYDVIVLEGKTAGRVWVGRDEKEIRLLDIALLPEFRGQGVGAVLVGALIEEARSAGKRLRHMVFMLNEGARRFYERLGFRVTEEFAGYLHMEWSAESD